MNRLNDIWHAWSKKLTAELSHTSAGPPSTLQTRILLAAIEHLRSDRLKRLNA